jgi:hypothetical protein
MEIKNVEQAEALIEQYQELMRKAAPIATRLAKLQGYSNTIDEDECRIDEYGDIIAEWEEYLGCSSYEDHSITVPLEYLFDDDYLTKAEEKQRREDEEKKRRYEEEQRIKKEKAAKEKEERDRKKYLELKAKYEGEGI